MIYVTICLIAILSLIILSLTSFEYKLIVAILLCTLMLLCFDLGFEASQKYITKKEFIIKDTKIQFKPDFKKYIINKLK
jgi:hypothetical protein